jgi:Asp-tRNA(Asn)/Glu-tRNA(Gln) amidotransferase A subunit family amidase
MDSTSIGSTPEPLGDRPDVSGLRVGVQVLAPALGEPVMFRVARAIEGLAP